MHTLKIYNLLLGQTFQLLSLILAFLPGLDLAGLALFLDTSLLHLRRVSDLLSSFFPSTFYLILMLSYLLTILFQLDQVTSSFFVRGFQVQSPQLLSTVALYILMSKTMSLNHVTLLSYPQP